MNSPKVGQFHERAHIKHEKCCMHICAYTTTNVRADHLREAYGMLAEMYVCTRCVHTWRDVHKNHAHMRDAICRYAEWFCAVCGFIHSLNPPHRWPISSASVFHVGPAVVFLFILMFVYMCVEN